MKLRLSGHSLFFGTLAFLLFATNVSWAQSDRAPKKRLRSPATVRGLVGGESMNNYVIRARKGSTMTVVLSWRKEEDNTASFSVSPAAPPDSEVVQGRESDNGKHWTGKIPRTGDYIISVTAHPSAHYNLRVTVK
jgi:hypothetical protein